MATAKCFKSNVDCEGCESEHEETVLITRIKKYLVANTTNKNVIYLSEIQSSLQATYPDYETRKPEISQAQVFICKNLRQILKFYFLSLLFKLISFGVVHHIPEFLVWIIVRFRTPSMS